MNEKQRQDLFVEWARYEPHKREKILAEYLEAGGNLSNKDVLLGFIAKRLEIKGYWKKTGLV